MTLALAFLGVVGVAFGVFLPAGLSWGGAFLLLGALFHALAEGPFAGPAQVALVLGGSSPSGERPFGTGPGLGPWAGTWPFWPSSSPSSPSGPYPTPGETCPSSSPSSTPGPSSWPTSP